MTIPDYAREKIRKKIDYIKENYDTSYRNVKGELGRYINEPNNNEYVIEKIVWLIFNDFNKKHGEKMRIEPFNLTILIKKLSEVYNISLDDLINKLKNEKDFRDFL